MTPRWLYSQTELGVWVAQARIPDELRFAGGVNLPLEPMPAMYAVPIGAMQITFANETYPLAEVETAASFSSTLAEIQALPETPA